jgi:hypothetical protein
LANFSDGFAPTLKLSLSGRDQLGKAGFQQLVAPAKGVVLRVGDRRRVLLVVAPVVLGDLGAQRLVLGAGVGGGERPDIGAAQRSGLVLDLGIEAGIGAIGGSGIWATS